MAVTLKVAPVVRVPATPPASRGRPTARSCSSTPASAPRSRSSRASTCVLRTPKFREDQFRDLFNEDSRASRRRAPGPPTPATDAAGASADAARDGDAPRRRSRQAGRDRLRRHPPAALAAADGLDVGDSLHQPRRQDAVLIAGAAGQQNLYSWSLDETARERPVARQLTTTAGAKARRRRSRPTARRSTTWTTGGSRR